ncbi:MAG: transporter substrate-binding domain-containing protein [Gammaproteobacteria bacterium]|nr:transporter substrate-binding domain-containing protein [Gammaproteobacteria bacterium]
MHTRGWIVLCGTLLLWLTTTAAAQTVRLVTLEWPPYVGKTLPHEGGSAAVVRAAFKEVGVDVSIEFMPWTRALKTGSYGKGYAGYFPAYRGDERSKVSLISEPIGSSPLGMARRADRSITWRNLDELGSFRLGVVSGYINTAEFDRRVSEGLLQTDIAPSDESNLKKLIVGRIDLAVIDRNVFDYLLRTQPTLTTHREELLFDGPLLEDKPLFVYFQRNADGERLRQLFHQGLTRINANKVFYSAVAEIH